MEVCYSFRTPGPWRARFGQGDTRIGHVGRIWRGRPARNRSLLLPTLPT